MARRLLLISNSTMHGEGFLDHCMGEIKAVLAERRRIVFVPFALFDREGYASTAGERFEREGFEVRALSVGEDGSVVLEWAEAVFVGGGNTFRLLKTLRDSGLLSAIRRRVDEGMVYMGASAGSNIAGPTIRTTNDMPIVQPDSFDALGLVDFQINPHYIDAPTGSVHMGETREQRLMEFLEENETAVVGLREGGWLRVLGGGAAVGGRSAILFRRGHVQQQLAKGASLPISDLA